MCVLNICVFDVTSPTELFIVFRLFIYATLFDLYDYLTYMTSLTIKITYALTN